MKVVCVIAATVLLAVLIVSYQEAYVQLQAIEKWNGVLPTTAGAAVPFFNIK